MRIFKEDIMKINRSILIVDDDITLSRLIQRLLERSGHDVSHCDNGFDAVTLSKERDFDMFLIDYNMPELTGDKVCKLIRNQHPNGYIVGYSGESKEQPFIDAGANKFIDKCDLVQDFSLMHQLV
jgi:CheY-like chemotaxis protein